MMVMRYGLSLIALPLLALAAPVAAQDVVFVSGTGDETIAEMRYDDDARDTSNRDTGGEAGMMEMADKIADPAMQDSVAAAVETMTSRMMRLPVGGFAEAIENARPGTVNRRIRRDTTIADLAGRDARDLPEELGARSREAMGMMSGFARAMAVMMPEFERMGRDMEESFKAAKADARRTRN
jgi:hypothetical protein